METRSHPCRSPSCPLSSYTKSRDDVQLAISQTILIVLEMDARIPSPGLQKNSN